MVFILTVITAMTSGMVVEVDAAVTATPELCELLGKAVVAEMSQITDMLEISYTCELYQPEKYS